MDATSLIQQSFDIDKLLSYYDFDRIKSDGEIIRACCKIHGGNNPTAFVINSETGLWYCHTGACGGGDVFTLVQLMEGIEFYHAVRWLADFFDVDIKNLHITQKKAKHISDLENFIKMIKAKRNKIFQPFNITEEMKEVVRFREFQADTLKHFQVGYVNKITLHRRNGNAYALHNRLVFPIFYKGMQIGASLRRVNTKDYPKWSHQPASIETKNILYNYDTVQHAQRIAVCEGITDVLAFYEIGVPAVCTFGSHISNEQYRLLLKTGADLVLAFDGDKAGRSVTQRAKTLFQYKANLYLMEFAENEDPESISREELEEKYGGLSQRL